MYTILKKEALNEFTVRMTVSAPMAAHRARAGQFVILRADARGERIPLTVAGYDREAGTVDVIFQIVGGATMSLASKREGEAVEDFAGPLGVPTRTDGLKKVAVIGGGVGCAIALPVVRELRAQGADVLSVIGFRTKGLVILEEEFRALSDRCVLVTDDASLGEKGNVCAPLSRILAAGEQFDEVFAAGPLPMMKAVAETTRPYAVKTVASMNPIMIDGTGMCGCCRVTVGGERKFACVDGPEFDAHLIDFDEAMLRLRTYAPFEARSRERHCNLFRMRSKEER